MTAIYHTITPEILTELQQIVGSRYVIADDVEELEKYSHDEIPDRHYASMPEIVIKPANTEEISAVLRLANRFPARRTGALHSRTRSAAPSLGQSVHHADECGQLDRSGRLLRRR